MSKVFIKNRKALHNYHILEKIEAGIELLGSEVKSIRVGRVDLGLSFARVINGEVFLINANIPSLHKDHKDYSATRQRKLLLRKDQIRSLIGKTSSGGTALIPISLYDKNNYLKIELGVGRSKHQVDRKKIIKERDNLRRLEQELRGKE